MTWEGVRHRSAFQALGEVVGGDEGQDMSLQAFQVVVVVDLDRGVLDRAVHPLGLAIGPRVVGLGQPVLDAMFDADAVEDVRTEQACAGPIPFLGRSAKAMPLSVSTMWIL